MAETQTMYCKDCGREKPVNEWCGCSGGQARMAAGELVRLGPPPRQMIDREKLLDALGRRADKALEKAAWYTSTQDVQDVDDSAYGHFFGEAAGLKTAFDLVAKFPAEEVE